MRNKSRLIHAQRVLTILNKSKVTLFHLKVVLFQGVTKGAPPLRLIQFPPEMDENWLRYELLN